MTEKITAAIEDAPVILRTRNFILLGMPNGKLWLENENTGEGTELDKKEFYDKFNEWMEKMFKEWM